MSVGAMLAVWEERSREWEQAGAQIAAVERRALLAIKGAGTIEAVDEVISRVSWRGRD